MAGAVQQKIDDLPSGFEERHLEDVKAPFQISHPKLRGFLLDLELSSRFLFGQDLLIPDLRVLSKRPGPQQLRFAEA